jgi:hypothetical protein
MVATVFKHVTQSDILVWVLKIVEYRVPEHHVSDIPEAVEIWRSANEDATWAKCLGEASQYQITWYRQVLNDL